MKTVLIIALFPFIAFGMNPDKDMTPFQIKKYMSTYDNFYDKSHKVSYRATNKRLNENFSFHAVLEICEEERKVHDDMAKGIPRAQYMKKDRNLNNYYATVASLNGRGDGRRDGCMDAVSSYRQHVRKNAPAFAKKTKPIRIKRQIASVRPEKVAPLKRLKGSRL